MSDGCPFLQWDRNASYFGSYVCRKRDEKVDDTMRNEYCKWDSYYPKCPYFKSDNGSGSGGCFLTTACVEHKGLPDDCRELTAMRKCRDGWLADQPGGKEVIEEYYRIAPTIVERIKARVDAEDILENLYQAYILVCVEAVEAGDMDKAYARYTEMVNKLRKGEYE